MSKDDSHRRHRAVRRLDTQSLSNPLVFEALSLLLHLDADGKPPNVQSVIDRVNERFGEELSREQAYQILRVGLERGFVSLNPPYNLALAQRIMDYFRLRPSEQVVLVVDVESEALAMTDAVEIAAARQIKQILLGLAGGGRIELGLGTGPTVLRTMKKLGELLRAENHRRSIFVVRPIEPAGYSALYSGTSPVSFARYLETPWTEVVIEPWQKTTDLQLAVLDAHESEPPDLPPGVEPRALVLLAGPGDLRSVRPWFDNPDRFTQAILDPETATGLVAME